MKTWTAKDLAKAFYKSKQLVILDIRDRASYEANHLEVKKGWSLYHFPYREVFSEQKDPVEALRTFAQQHLNDKPEILAVCARGNTSKTIVDMLDRLGYPAATLEGGMQGWKEHDETQEILITPALSIYQIQRVGRGCLSYLIKKGERAFAIDPSRHLAHYIELAAHLKSRPEAVYDTHAHADHLSGGRALAKHWHVPYYLHPYDAIHPMDLLPAEFSYSYLQEGKGVPFEVLHIPGHTLGNCAFFLEKKFLFAGDSIFISSIARPDLGGKDESWTLLHYHSLRKLLALPDETLILPAHFGSFDEVSGSGIFAKSLGEIRNTNEGLILAQKPFGEFKRYILDRLPEFPPEYIDIKRANLGLVEFTEEESSILETGKNVCAIK